jgi:hypothetical protein
VETVDVHSAEQAVLRFHRLVPVVTEVPAVPLQVQLVVLAQRRELLVH